MVSINSNKFWCKKSNIQNMINKQNSKEMKLNEENKEELQEKKEEEKYEYFNPNSLLKSEQEMCKIYNPKTMKILSCNEIISNYNQYSNHEFNLLIIYQHPLYIILNKKTDEIFKFIYNDEFIKYIIPDKKLSPYEMVAPILYHRYYAIKRKYDIIENNLYEWKQQCVNCYFKYFINSSNIKEETINEYLLCHGIIGLFYYLDYSKYEYQSLLDIIINNIDKKFFDTIYCDFIRVTHLLNVVHYNYDQQLLINESIDKWRHIFDNGINKKNILIDD